MAKKHTTALGTLGRQALQGGTLGFADEIIDVPTAMIVSKLVGVPFEEILKDARSMSKKDLAKDWEERPKSALVSNIVGSIPFGAKSIQNLARGSTVLAGIGKGAAVGAGLGGIQGVGSADDSWSDRLSGGATGAAIGGALGGAVGGLTGRKKPPPSAGGDLIKAAKKTAKKMGSAAEKHLANQLARLPDLESKLAAAEETFALARKKGINITLPEALANQSDDFLITQQGKLSSEPMTAGRMSQFYENRGKQVSDYASKLASEVTPVSSYDEAAEKVIEQAGKRGKEITQELSAKAKPFYDEAHKKLVNPNQLKSIIKSNPDLTDYIKMTRADPSFAKMVRGKPDNSVEVLDAVRRKMSAVLENNFDPAKPANTRAVSQSLDALDGLVYKYAPALKQARGIYSNEAEKLAMRQRLGPLSQIENNKDVARKLFEGTKANADVAAQALGPDASKMAVAARVQGAVDDLRGSEAGLRKKIIPNDTARQQIQSYLGNEGTDTLENNLNLLEKTGLSDRVRFGSPTEPRLAAGESLAQGAKEIGGAAMDVATKNVPSLLSRASKIVDKQQQPQFYDDMYKLFTTDDGLDFLRRLTQEQRTQLQNVMRPNMLQRVDEGVKDLTQFGGFEGVNSLRPSTQQGQVASISSAMSPVDRDVYDPMNDPEYQQMFGNEAKQAYDPLQDPEYMKLFGNPERTMTESNTVETLPAQNNPMRVPEDDFLDKVEQLESGGNPNARAKTSSASGAFQFTDPTWKSMVNKYGAANNIKLEDKMNPDAQRIMAKLLSDENSAYLSKQGHKTTPENLYLAHFLGAGGSDKVLDNMNSPAASLLPQAAKANQAMFYNKGRPRTGLELQQLIAQKLAGA